MSATYPPISTPATPPTHTPPSNGFAIGCGIVAVAMGFIVGGNLPDHPLYVPISETTTAPALTTRSENNPEESAPLRAEGEPSAEPSSPNVSRETLIPHADYSADHNPTGLPLILTTAPPCTTEDQPYGPCIWDASLRGDGTGLHFYVSEDGSVLYGARVAAQPVTVAL